MPKFDATMIDTEAVRTRTLELAIEAGEQVRETFLHVHDKHIKSGVLAVGVAEAMAWDEFHEATDKFIHEKNAGKHNDTENLVARGVTALIFPSAKSTIELQLERTPQGLFAPTIEKVGETVAEEGTDPSIYRLELPSGCFDAEASNFQVKFHVEAETMGIDTVFPRSNPFFVHNYQILRIVGGGGELWQNPKLNLDGTYTAPPVVNLGPSSIRS